MSRRRAHDPKTGKFLKDNAVTTVQNGVSDQGKTVEVAPKIASAGTSPAETPAVDAEAQSAHVTPLQALPASSVQADGLDPLTVELTEALPKAPAPAVVEPPVAAPAASEPKKSSGWLIGLGVLLAGAAVVGLAVLSGGKAVVTPKLPVDGLR